MRAEIIDARNHGTLELGNPGIGKTGNQEIKESCESTGKFQGHIAIWIINDNSTHSD